MPSTSFITSIPHGRPGGRYVDDTTGMRVPRVRTLALAGIVGPIFFTVLVVVQGFLRPEYSHVKMPISALAAWPTGWIQTINFYVVGLLMIAFAVALHLGVQATRRGGTGFALLLMSGFGRRVGWRLSVEDGQRRSHGNTRARRRRDHGVRLDRARTGCVFETHGRRSAMARSGTGQGSLTTDHRHGVFDFAHTIHSSATAGRSLSNRDISSFVILF